MSYVAQLLPDRTGAEVLRIALWSFINPDQPITEPTDEQLDAAHDLLAKLTADMRKRDRR
jgi:hypothetical protein